MVQLDLKKLSKGMHIRDKMKLLFEDMNRQAETEGKESLLTPQERDAIVDDARKSGEIREIRRVYEFYRTALFLDIDMGVAELHLYLAISQIEKILMGIILKGAADDIISEIFYDIAHQNNNISSDVEDTIQKLRVKYKIDSVILKGFDLFTTPEDSEDASSVEKQITEIGSLEPNPEIQQSFMLTFLHAKKLKTILYKMSYVVSKAPIDFLPASTKRLVKDSEELIAQVCTLDGSLSSLRIYRDYADAFAKDATLVEPKFLETIQDIKTHLELNAEEKDGLEKKIDDSLKGDVY